MESYPDTIVVAKNVSVPLRHSAERLNRYQRVYYRILRQQGALFRYNACDHWFLHPR